MKTSFCWTYVLMFLCSFYPTRVQEDLGGAILPPTLSLSSENLEHDGIYLLENGEDAMLYVNSQASREVLYQIFGVHSIDELQVGQVKWLTAQEALKSRMYMLVSYTSIPRHDSCNFGPL